LLPKLSPALVFAHIYLFWSERASGGKEYAQLEERQQGIYLLGAIQPPPQQPQEAKQIRDLQAGAE